MSNTEYCPKCELDDTTGDKTRSLDTYSIQYVEESATTLLKESMGISSITVDCLYTKVKFLNRPCATGLNQLLAKCDVTP